MKLYEITNTNLVDGNEDKSFVMLLNMSTLSFEMYKNVKLIYYSSFSPLFTTEGNGGFRLNCKMAQYLSSC